jgi:hypothetical protein
LGTLSLLDALPVSESSLDAMAASALGIPGGTLARLR